MSIDVVVLWSVSTPSFISKRCEVIRKITESVIIWLQLELYSYLSILHIFL
jgi:hypothetical protein